MTHKTFLYKKLMVAHHQLSWVAAGDEMREQVGMRKVQTAWRQRRRGRVIKSREKDEEEPAT